MAVDSLATGSEIEVLVVDDSVFMRTALLDMLKTDSHIIVVGEAADGAEAIRLAEKLRPAVVTLDLIMPGMDALAVLEALRRLPKPPAVLIVSAYAKQEADLALECLKHGAVDIIQKPIDSIALKMGELGPQLCAKVKAAAMARTGHETQRTSVNTHVATAPGHNHGGIVIGSSTGGPTALETILPGLPQHFPCPIMIAQHLPALFVTSLVERLSSICTLPVRIAQNGDAPQAGSVYFCPGDTDTRLQTNDNGVAEFSVGPPASNLSPSIDALFSSAAAVFGAHTTGFILTGMGEDGVAGARAIRNAGGHVYAQDRHSSIIYGMPRAVTEADLATQVLSLNQIATWFTSYGGVGHGE